MRVCDFLDLTQETKGAIQEKIDNLRNWHPSNALPK